MKQGALFETLCQTCDGQRRIVGHRPGCERPNCDCIESNGWHIRCPECSPELLPEVEYRPDLVRIPY